LIFDTRRHSREHEAEADRYAYRFMKKAGYDAMAIKSCLQLLDVLDDSLLYKRIALTDIFNFPEYPFKKRWIQKESSIFSQMKTDDSPLTKAERDSMKSHPDCENRILLLQDSLKTTAGKKFIISEDMFRELKREFPLEIMQQHYREQNLGRQLYTCLLLMQKEEYRSLAVYTIARILNELYERQKNHTMGLRVGKESRFLPEDYNLLLRMLDRIRLDEIAAVNYNFCNAYREQMKTYSGFDEELRKAQTINK
jgi:hypothetical protein